MDERSRVLDLFEEKKARTERRIAEGIEQYRKGDATITLVDVNGKHIKNAKVKIRQTSHAFRFGANLFMLEELESAEKNAAYKKAFADVFNMATLPFYWDTLEPTRGQPRYARDSGKVYRRPPIDLCIEFCEQNGIEPREHALAYEHLFPTWLRGAPTDTVKRELERRFSEISSRYADKIRTIEVTNEMDWERGVTEFYDDPDFVQWCFETARKYFPHNQLGINEWTELVWQGKCRATDPYYAYTEANLLRGAPIDAIGLQYHLFNPREKEYELTRRTLDPDSLYDHMDLYARLGKPLQVTEVTVPAYSWDPEDEEIQAQIIGWLYAIWFSHPAVEQIIYWNLVDGYAYVPYTDPDKIAASQGDMTNGENYYYGGLLRFDMTPKPAFEKIRELTQRVWHTEVTSLADARGSVAFRGFYGDYVLEVTVDGRTVTKPLTLAKGAENAFTITI